MREASWLVSIQNSDVPSLSYNGRSLGLNRHFAHIWQYQTLPLEQAEQFVWGTITSGLELNIYEDESSAVTYPNSQPHLGSRASP
jgi:hypothetical protein